MELKIIKNKLNMLLSDTQQIINIFWDNKTTPKQLVIEIMKDGSYKEDFNNCKKINKLFNINIDSDIKVKDYVLNITTIDKE